MSRVELDTKDRQLLDLLQQDARQSLEALAGEVGLSAPAVQRRIKRLRAEGVIEREVAVVNPVAVGLPMTFIVIVELERESADQIDVFRRKVIAEPQVQQGYYVTGEGDFVIIAVARDMDDFEALTRKLFFDDPNVRRFRTSVAMGKGFRSLNVPAVYAGDADGE
ncbi:MAG: Lrp/AsnC family transcriptional regulator [Halofilum sp. (in: g-proteobacteria)]